MPNFIDKINHSKNLIRESAQKYKNIAAACSFGKDSIVVVHLAKSVAPEIPIFYTATVFKPSETLEYAVEMNKRLNLNMKVYLVANEIPQIFKDSGVEVILLPTREFDEAEKQSRVSQKKSLFETNPDICCQLLKVEPTKEAVKNLDAWFTGLRRTEGYTRENFQEVEKKGNLVKINPILDWTELDVWRYLAMNQLPSNPLYARGYRSLGCAVCSKIIDDSQGERDGRWQNTSKCGGECGIHTKELK